MFQDWVVPYLKKMDEDFSSCDAIFDDIKNANFNFLKAETNDRRQLYIKVATALIRELNCNLTSGQKPERKNCENFIFIFCSVIANLKREYFDILLNSKNTFFIYGPREAFVKSFNLKKLNITIDEEENLKVVAFSHELGDIKHCNGNVDHSWLHGRFAVAHELGHIIFPEYDEGNINKKLEEWGFNKEVKFAQEKDNRRFMNEIRGCLNEISLFKEPQS